MFIPPISETQSKTTNTTPGGAASVGALTTSPECVSPLTNAAHVAEFFFNSATLDALAVVEGRKPIGLVTRQKLLMRLFYRFGYELFGKDPIISLAEVLPLIIGEDERIESAIKKSIDRDAAMVYDEIIVVDCRGDFVGLLSVKQLVMQQHQLLSRQINENVKMIELLRELAHKDPLTGLYNRISLFEAGALLHAADCEMISSLPFSW